MQACVTRIGVAAAIGLLMFSGTAEAASLQSATLAKAPVLDGKIDEGEWAGAMVSEQGFVQFEPGFGNPASFRTAVRVGQTETSLFVAIEAFDPEIANLSASVTRRDGITTLDANDPVRSVIRDDSVAVFLDAFGDGRTAYIFRTNALATQEDARINDNGRAVDLSWDGIWRNAVMRYEDRWIVEYEIPFATLVYNTSGRPWRVNFVRSVPRRLETDVWSGPSPSVYRVSEFGDLTIAKPPEQSADAWQVIPYSTLSFEAGKGMRGQFGADIRWRPSPNLGADVTLNPDFSLVDPDIEVVNLTRFEVLVPERRPFFLEGTEMYNQRYRQFNSRRLGNISWGAKTNGKVGGTDFSVIAASENSRFQNVAGESTAQYAIARVQQSLWRGSSVGLLAANRTLNDVNTGTVGLDTTMFFTDTLNFTGQIYRVHGAGADGGLVWYLRPSYDSARTHFHVRWGHFAPGILKDANVLGFLQDDNRKEIDTNFGHTIFFESGLLERMRPSVNYNRFTGFDQSVLRGWALSPRIAAVLRNRLEFDISRRDEYRLFDNTGYRNHETTLTAGWNNRQGRSVFVYAGKGVNFGNDLLTYGGEARWVFGDNWRMSYNLARVELAPDFRREDTVIHVFDTTYSFSPDLFVRGFVQTNSAIGKETFQLLGVWRFKPPFGAFQIAYQKGTSAFGQVSTQGHTFFTKLSWVL